MKSRRTTTYDVEYLFEFVAINTKLTMLPKSISMAFLNSKKWFLHSHSIWSFVQGYNIEPTELTRETQIESLWR